MPLYETNACVLSLPSNVILSWQINGSSHTHITHIESHSDSVYRTRTDTDWHNIAHVLYVLVSEWEYRGIGSRKEERRHGYSPQGGSPIAWHLHYSKTLNYSFIPSDISFPILGPMSVLSLCMYVLFRSKDTLLLRYTLLSLQLRQKQGGQSVFMYYCIYGKQNRTLSHSRNYILYT